MDSTTVLSDVHVDTALGEVSPTSLYAALCGVTDYRHKRGRWYEAAVLLVVIVLAKLAGEKCMSGIAEWARLRSDWLCGVLPLRCFPVQILTGICGPH